MAIIKKFRIKSFKKIETVIEFKNVSIAYGNRLILDNINFKVNKNSIHGMLGPNGVGKSTIFNLITGLISPKNGKIKINGELVNEYPVYQRTRNFKIGYVPQYGGYFGDLSLLNNLKAIGEIVIENKNIRTEKINFLLSKFELENVKSIKAKFLSGGQKKLLELGRTMMVNAKLVLLDEVGAGVNRTLLKDIGSAILRLNKEKGYTFCMIEHDMDFISRLCNPVIVMSEGSVLFKGTSDEVKNNEQVIESYLGRGSKSKNGAG